MHKSLNTLGLVGAALAFAMTPALAAAQDQTMPGSMPETPANTGTPPTGTPPTDVAPATVPPVHTPGMPHQDTTNTTETVPPTSEPAPLSEAERTEKMKAWAEEQRTAFETWTPETQNYFWTLSEERQKIFWRIADADKATLSTMAEPQREATWVELENRLKAMQG